ncbi:hypothetical protein FRC17_000130 [Serendipita sp. 399]|nr:hypothetical protein FRC17_000130 [Serendipita sp. 399]
MSTGFENTDKWFISFASGYNGVLTTPKNFALGSTLPTKTTGMNPRTKSYLAANRGAYFGVVMFDYIGSDQGLINATLGWETTSWGTTTVRFAHSAVYAPLFVFLALAFAS